MTETVIFSFPEYEALAENIAKKNNYKMGDVTIRRFPDGESFVQIHDSVKDKEVIIVCGLDRPDRKIMPLIFLLDVCRELSAKRVGLVTPYLGYMRQDKRFNYGEAVTSEIFAPLLSKYMNWAVTVDPHLHRHHSMDEIYTVPFTVLHAADSISVWIKDNIEKPILVGPDSESEQWVSAVAKKAGAPFMVLQKIRHGDKDVEVSVPDVDKYKNHTPVLVDDIISTARTMIRTVEHLNKAGMQKTVCIGVHAVFAEDGYEALKNSGVARIVTCNTITHKTNAIDLSGLIANELKKIVK